MSSSLVANFFRRRLLQPVLNLLRQGMTPHKLAVTVSVGMVVGVLPFFGVTTVLGTALAARFRLNIAATVLISYLVQPLQLLFFLPFIKAGILLYGLEELRLSLEEMVAMFRADWVEALAKLWVANLAGVSVWALLALPAGAVLYFALMPLLRSVLPKPAMPVAPEQTLASIPAATPRILPAVSVDAEV